MVENITLNILSGNAQTGAVNSTFAIPLRLRLLKNGHPFAGENLSFTINAGQGAELSFYEVVTDEEGYGEVFFTAGGIPGTYEVLVSWNAGGATAVFGLLAQSTQKILKIVAGGLGDQPVVAAHQVLIGSQTTLKAALFDPAGNYLEDANAVWSIVSGSVSPASDLSPAVSASPTAIFSPTVPGQSSIMAIYDGSDSGVITTTAKTGIFTADVAGTPTTITIIGGNSQTGIVGASPALPLRVQVHDQFGRELQGAGVIFSVVSGGGHINGANPAYTDVDGEVSTIATLGTVPGINIFRAALTGNPTVNVNFAITSAHDAVTQIVFTRQPSNSFMNAPFGVQPLVELQDQYGNTTTSATGTVTLSAVVGCGTVTGTATANVVNGLAVFANSGCDTSGAGTVLRANYGALIGDSASFTVNGAPPGACQTNDAFFQTADGGCKDLTSGLVWSAKSASTMNWFQAVWDQESFVGNANTQDAGDYGRTNEYGGFVTNLGGFDNSAVHYCHDLVEGGQSDWRLPSRDEFQALYDNVHAGGRTPPYIHATENEVVFTGNSHNDTAHAFIFNLQNGTVTNNFKTVLLKVYCVRGHRTMADRLIITTQGSDVMGINTTENIALFPFTINIQDSLGNNATTQNVAVTVTSSLGTVGGTDTVITDWSGRAVFNAFTLDTVGEQTLTFSAPGFTPATVAIKVGEFPNTCITEDTYFETTEGGCKHHHTGLVWSWPSPTPISWHDAIWGYEAGVFNTGDPPKASDGLRENDYDSGSHGGTPDASIINYCHQLNEGGFSDWRLPTRGEIESVIWNGTGARHYFYAVKNLTEYFWTSTTSPANHARADRCRSASNSSDCQTNNTNKTASNRVMCVRP